jgi:hypothetical protein
LSRSGLPSLIPCCAARIWTAAYPLFAIKLSGLIPPHLLRAIAKDQNGVAGPASSEIDISVTTNSPPAVAITSPLPGAPFNAPANVVITATATDSAPGNVVEVEFFAGAQSLGNDTAPPYTVTWPTVPIGNHTLTARAKDNEGVTTTSSPVSITVDGVTTAITAPANGASFTTTDVFNVTATATTSSGNLTKLELLDGAAVLQTFNTNSTTVDVTIGMSGVTAGSHSYTVRATDSGGRVATSVPVNVTVAAPAAVTLTAPSGGVFHVAPEIITLAANVTAGSNPIDKVEFFAGTILVGTDTSAPYEVKWATAPVGNHSLTAKATQSGGATVTSVPVAITVAAAPTVAVTAGIDGLSTPNDNVLITGTIQAPANSAVTVKGQPGVLTPNGQFFVNGVELAAGANTLPVTVTTQYGATATQSITVNSTGSSPFRVEMSDFEGVAPLEILLSVDNPSNAPFATIEYDTNDDGQPDHVATTLAVARVTLSYSTAGLRQIRIKVKDAQGGELLNTVRRVYAVNPLDRYQMMKGVFDGMLGWLRVGDLDVAVIAINPLIRDKYKAMFASVGSNIGAVADQIGAIRWGGVNGRFGELVIQRGGQGFIATLVRGADGIWRIEGM